MAKNKVFRIKDEVGPDYKCSVCGIVGFRLWRDYNCTLDAIDLHCASCAESVYSAEVLKQRSSPYYDENDCQIGPLVPARPTDDGDNFWGHSSGDIAWWHCLPQFAEPSRELPIVVRERNRYVSQADDFGAKWLEEIKRANKAERDCKEAVRFAKLEGIPK